MAFGEEARLLMMRILQNFVRTSRGKWGENDWQQLVERIRRLGFDAIPEPRMRQLADENRERWLAGENGIGPAPVPVPATPAPAPAPAPLGAPDVPAAQQTQSIDVAGVVEAIEAATSAASATQPVAGGAAPAETPAAAAAKPRAAAKQSGGKKQKPAKKPAAKQAKARKAATKRPAARPKSSTGRSSAKKKPAGKARKPARRGR